MKNKPNAVWYWVAQQGGSGFTKSALPGDRNWMILLEQKFQKRMNIKKAVYKAKGADLPELDWFSGMPERSMIELTLEEGGGKFTFYVDQLLYCLGGNPAAEGSISTILHETLKRQLEPVEDINYMVSSNGKGVLAWATPKREVMIIGSAAFNFQDKGCSKKPQAAPMEFLPPNAQVPDGIAVTVSTLEALNNYMPVTSANGGKSLKWNINFNTSNRTQLAAFLASTTKTDAFTANLQVALLVYLRSKNNFGLNEEQVDYVLDLVEQFVIKLRAKIPTLEKDRLAWDQQYGADALLQYYVKLMTTGDKWSTFWQKQQIKCA